MPLDLAQGNAISGLHPTTKLFLGVGGLALVGWGAYRFLVSEAKAADSTNGRPNNGGSSTLKPPPDVDSPQWGKVPKKWRELIRETEIVAKLPGFWWYISVCINRESDWQPRARNDSAHETKFSRLGIERGLERGNPKPTFAEEAAAFGSGGLAGALASSFVWIGIDTGFMPFLNEPPELMYEPKASMVFAAHYYYRMNSSFYKKNIKDRPFTMWDVRLGWRSPDALRNRPNGSLSKDVRGRMREDMQELGFTESSMPIPDRTHYAGIRKVSKHFGYS